jgi:glycosyltransferase involved in cell wall biosynthesis
VERARLEEPESKGAKAMHVLILGSRGIPSKHSGFETFAQDFALFLRSRDHEVTVYCQVEEGEPACEDRWHGIRRVMIPAGKGSVGTILFDWKTIRHAMREKGVALTLGYNTGIFNILYRFNGMSNIMNMDGIEWKRAKWSRPAKLWFWLNEWAGARVANHLVADHPEIGKHLLRHTANDKIAVIPYGADAVTSAPVSPIQKYDISSKDYYLLIARTEPENSIFEIVRAYSLRQRGIPLVILGNYKRDGTPYQNRVLDAAGPEIKFLGAIFDRDIVRSLRFHARAYFHGHRVGGTNPSLVEALAAGNAVIAHDNRFTRWVAGEGARFFQSEEDISEIVDSLNSDPAQLLAMEKASRKRHAEAFTQEQILTAYEKLLLRFAPAAVVETETVSVPQSVA